MDKIEKKTHLKASLSRVWRAIADSREYGLWFGLKAEGPFVAGEVVQVSISPTTVDEEVAKMQAPHAGMAFELAIDRIEPERLFSFRWHPFALNVENKEKEPMTLVTFTLQPEHDGVLLTITETGFDRLPPARQAEAYCANDGGWTKQAELIAKYLARG